MSYQIRVRGHLSTTWSGWFDGLAISQVEDGDTLISGGDIDQAALHGILKKVRDLGLTLLSVNSLQPLPHEDTNDKEQNA